MPFTSFLSWSCVADVCCISNADEMCPGRHVFEGEQVDAFNLSAKGFLSLPITHTICICTQDGSYMGSAKIWLGKLPKGNLFAKPAASPRFHMKRIDHRKKQVLTLLTAKAHQLQGRRNGRFSAPLGRPEKCQPCLICQTAW